MSPISEQTMAGLAYPGRHGYKIGLWICRLGSLFCRARLAEWWPEGRRLPALAGSSASSPTDVAVNVVLDIRRQARFRPVRLCSGECRPAAGAGAESLAPAR
jgi:hypothetical protein